MEERAKLDFKKMNIPLRMQVVLLYKGNAKKITCEWNVEEYGISEIKFERGILQLLQSQS
jgi:hypothetical protein